ncbi:HAD-IC family P-type ATPase [Chitinibacter fontanus]|uniref:HAD-IC family P-type ATPase n=1 Tax=Chitinibacter fontanus TaxID=1737446 RepID=A0A7D5VAM3_9NEIS|nr:HAD-IC family P-type ATPase [Chitinibacter fontanus]QLI82196.1 HAD-IC family P-type ATPase [Chitinibacter fontanus]
MPRPPLPHASPAFSHAHALTISEITTRLNVNTASGLDSAAVNLHRNTFGSNTLAQTASRSGWLVFLSQFRSALILVLIGAALLSASIGNYKDAVIILSVVLINALVSFYQEYRAEQSLSALKAMLPPQTQVRRQGKLQTLEASALVPGDIVLLEAGDRVPADGRLILAASLEIDESSLTGESLPCAKQVGSALAANTPLAERHNMAYMNTLVTRGRAELLITATGAHTEMGQISALLASTSEAATPLQLQLDVLGKKLGLIAIIMVLLLAGLEWLRGEALAQIMLNAIALGVAAIPEGLPVVVTVTLALGMHQMAKQHAIVKRLASVETLGCTTVICSDKTGTLTLNQMTAKMVYFQQRWFDISGEGYHRSGDISARDQQALPDFAPLCAPLVACNDSRLLQDQIIGDPMEAALLVLAHKLGSESAIASRHTEIPFDSAHKYMATFHRVGDTLHIFVKGAPEVLLALSSHSLHPAGLSTMSETERQHILAAYTQMAEQGLRGLLIASRQISASQFAAAPSLHQHINELTFVALLGLQDPPRPEARTAIAHCQQAGIAVKMITGDHQATGMAIAQQLGLAGRSITGTELELLSETQLAEQIEQIVVFARVSPAHKVKIVTALQANQHVVAMTGDGVNDAPALKTADIGIAMGKQGSAVAKEAATMVLTDDNFATIVSAVQQGRTLYENILKFVRFQLSTTIGAVLTVFAAPLLGLPAPFTPIQILWIAIIMDGPPAISLALDPARADIMVQTPRSRDAAVLSTSRLTRIVACGGTMMVGTLGLLAWSLTQGSAERAATMAFTTFVLFQFFNVFNARNEQSSAFNPHFFSNRMLWLSLSGVLALQIIAVHWPPAQALFATHGMNWSDWPICIAIASSIWLLEEARKYLYPFFHRYLARSIT